MIRALTFFSLMIFTFNAYAENICDRLTGTWYGSFILKDMKECHLYHGCKHEMLASVKRIDGATFTAEVHPKAGTPTTVKLTCINNTLTTHDFPDNTIEFTCLDKTICNVKYDDPKLYASLLGSGYDK